MPDTRMRRPSVLALLISILTLIPAARAQCSTAPTLTASTNRCREILLTWTPIPNAFQYRIYLGNSLLTSVGGASSQYLISNVTGSGTFQVRASGMFCDGPLSNAATGSPVALPLVPGCLARPVCGGVSVVPTITLGAGFPTTFNVYRALAGQAPVDSGPIAIGVPYVDTTGTPGVVYSYYVTVSNACGATAPSIVVQAAAPGPLQQPVILAAAGFCDGSHLLVAPCEYATSMTVNWLDDLPGVFHHIGTVPPTGGLFVDTSIPPGDQRSYIIDANDRCGVHLMSQATPAVQRPAALNVAGTVSATDRSLCTGVLVSWTRTTSEGGPYALLVRRGPSFTIGESQVIATLTDSDTSYLDTAVTAVRGFSYWVTAQTPCASMPLQLDPALGGRASICCDSIDFNADGLYPDTTDIDDFLSVFSGGPCSTGNCNDIDFNNDGLFPDTNDIDSLLSVFSGGACL